jgi:hypothetical protein
MWTGVKFEPCGEEQMYAVYASPTGEESGQQAASNFAPLMFAERRCFSTRTTITVTGEFTVQEGTKGEPVKAGTAATKSGASDGSENDSDPTKVAVTHKYVLDLGRLYVATAQAGVLAKGLQSSSFGLRPDVATDTQRIYNKGPVNTGPVYVATVVLYGFLHHVPSLFGEPRYRGRDPLLDMSLVDRLGLVVGAGLPKPGDNFFAGGSLELLAGVNVTYGWHIAKVTELATGFSESDAFKGEADAIPTRSAWRNKRLWGVSLDLRYLGRLLPGG